MSAGYGMRGHALLQFQNSYGTALTASLHAVPFRDESLEHSIEPLVEQNMHGRFAESPYHEGMHSVRGNLAGDANPTALGNLLKGAFGSLVTTSAAGIQTHVITPLTADFDDRAAVRPMTIELNRDVGSAALYFDMLVNALTLNINQGQLMSWTAEFLGAHRQKRSPGTPVFPTSPPFIWDQVSATYNGQALTDLRQLSLRFSNNLEAQYTLGLSKSPYRIKRTQKQEVRVTGMATFTTHSYWDAFLSQLEQRLTFNFKAPEAPHLLTWDMGAFRFTKFSPLRSNEGLVEANFEGVGTYSVDSAEAVRVTLVNTQTYY